MVIEIFSLSTISLISSLSVSHVAPNTKNTLYICNQILKLNKEIIKKLNFKIIIGQFCKQSFYNKIKKKFKNFYNCKIIYGVKSNYYNYLWSDTVICGDGTTKYEALAAGRYAIVIKTNKSNDIYGKDFEKLGLLILPAKITFLQLFFFRIDIALPNWPSDRE